MYEVVFTAIAMKGGELMAFDKSQLAANLRAFRAYKGVSQAEAAMGIGISTNMLGLYECGKSAPSYEIAWSMADYYQTSIDALGGRS